MILIRVIKKVFSQILKIETYSYQWMIVLITNISELAEQGKFCYIM